MSVVEQDDPTPPVTVPLHRRLRGGRTLSDGHRLYWWGEILAVALFYLVYSFVRNLHHGNEHEAFEHALDIIRLQKSLGINHEQAIQAWALGSRTVHHRRQLLLRLVAFHRDRRRDDLPLPPLDRRLPALAQHARHRHRARAHRFRVLPAACRRGSCRHSYCVRRHARERSRVLVVQLGGGQQDLQPVRGDAQRALRVGTLVRLRAGSAREAQRGPRCWRSSIRSRRSR